MHGCDVVARWFSGSWTKCSPDSLVEWMSCTGGILGKNERVFLWMNLEDEREVYSKDHLDIGMIV